VAIDGAGNVFVIDDKRDDVQVFTADGRFLRAFAGHGSGEGQLSFTGTGAFDAAGNLWIADFDNARLAVFADDGTFLRNVGAQGSGPGQFSSPGGVAFDGAGDVLIADGDNGRVEALDRAGRYLGEWNTDQDSSLFRYPVSIAADGKDRVYVLSVDLDDLSYQGSPVVRAYRLPPAPGAAATPAT
jgi:DNA-binding beta-propeller fold protein YncE